MRVLISDAEVRCSGDLPRCANCERGNLACFYDPARRDRLGEYVEQDDRHLVELTFQGNAAEPRPRQCP